MKEEFKPKAFGPDALARIEVCNDIIDDYLADNLKLTLRQLYYQLVSKNVIPNEEKSYKGLGKLLSEARLAGLVDWSAIEDRGRLPKTPGEYENLQELVEAASYSYRLPRWANQGQYVELWVEKDALAGVLAPIARKFHVTLMVNKGYSSTSAMYESAERYKANREVAKGKFEGDERDLSLLYLGDMDPSGEDMARDIRDRMSTFGVELDVRKIALTMKQVQQYNPPPNPAKLTDSRAASYVAKHGNSSWEVDALPPRVLTKLITSALEACLDRDLWDAVLEREEEDKRELAKAAEKIMKKKGRA